MKQAFNKILYALFPKRCEFCGDVISPWETRCDKCRLNVRIEGEVCAECGLDKDSCKCRKRKGDRPDYDAVIAPYRYQRNVEIAVHRFKFGGYTELADAFSRDMAELVKQKYGDVAFDAVAYVPISKAREKKRGYNQSLLLAQGIANALNISLENVFYKAYEGPAQRNLSARQRSANVFGAFDINENINPNGKIYLLVDDVKTTGATLSECAAVLKSYGANEVYAVALAIR
ncbi:MAG: ComF family protein [Eubacterium sp.]